MKNNRFQDDNYGIPKDVLNARIEQIKAENRKQRQDDVHPIFGIIGIILFFPLLILLGFHINKK